MIAYSDFTNSQKVLVNLRSPWLHNFTVLSSQCQTCRKTLLIDEMLVMEYITRRCTLSTILVGIWSGAYKTMENVATSFRIYSSETYWSRLGENVSSSVSVTVYFRLSCDMASSPLLIFAILSQLKAPNVYPLSCFEA